MSILDKARKAAGIAGSALATTGHAVAHASPYKIAHTALTGVEKGAGLVGKGMVKAGVFIAMADPDLRKPDQPSDSDKTES